jgi:hypothetical protein
MPLFMPKSVLGPPAAPRNFVSTVLPQPPFDIGGHE